VEEARGPSGPTRRAMVTGASEGIGRAFAQRLARDQMELSIVARSQDRLDALAAELRESRGVAVEVRTVDLSEADEVGALCRSLAERPPDLLVNNAGFGTVGRFAELDPAGEEREILLNVLALSRLTRAALPGMVARGHGAIVNVSSLASLAPSPYSATYGATKAFVTSFSEALYEELRGSGVKIQALLPGFTRTEFQERAGVDASAVPAFAWMESGDVVDASLEALERDEPVCIPGVANRLLSRAQRLVPRNLTRRIYAAAMKRSLGD